MASRVETTEPKSFRTHAQHVEDDSNKYKRLPLFIALGFYKEEYSLVIVRHGWQNMGDMISKTFGGADTSRSNSFDTIIHTVSRFSFRDGSAAVGCNNVHVYERAEFEIYQDSP